MDYWFDLAEEGALRLITQALRIYLSYRALVKAAFYAYSNLMLDCEENKLDVIKLGALDIAAEGFRLHQTCPSLLAFGCKFFSNLSYQSPMYQKMVWLLHFFPASH